MYHSFSLKATREGARPSAWVGPFSLSLRATAMRTIELTPARSKGRYGLNIREMRPTVASWNIVRMGRAIPGKLVMLATLFVGCQ